MPTMRARRPERDRAADPHPHQGRGGAGEPFRLARRRRPDARYPRYGLRRLHGAGPAAPPHRGMEIHRPPRADAGRAGARRARARRGRARGTQDAPMSSPDSTVRRSSSSTATSCPRCPTWRGSRIRWISPRSGASSPTAARSSIARSTRRRRRSYALNSAFVRDGAVLKHPRRREAGAAAGDREPLCRRRAPACRRCAIRSRSARA